MMNVSAMTGERRSRGAARTLSCAPRHQARASRRPDAFTLIESLMASAILLVVVFSVSAAITAGQQNSREAQERIAGSLAAEELLGRLITIHYNDLPSWHNYSEEPGQMIDAGGVLLPDSINIVGRRVSVTTTLESVSGLDVRIRGRLVEVVVTTPTGREIVTLTHFVPEPS
jgi:hypothetical protein